MLQKITHVKQNSFNIFAIKSHEFIANWISAQNNWIAVDNGLDAIVTVDAGDDTLLLLLSHSFSVYWLNVQTECEKGTSLIETEREQKKNCSLNTFFVLHIQLESITNLNHNYFNKV